MVGGGNAGGIACIAHRPRRFRRRYETWPDRRARSSQSGRWPGLVERSSGRIEDHPSSRHHSGWPQCCRENQPLRPDTRDSVNRHGDPWPDWSGPFLDRQRHRRCGSLSSLSGACHWTSGETSQEVRGVTISVSCGLLRTRSLTVRLAQVLSPSF